VLQVPDGKLDISVFVRDFSLRGNRMVRKELLDILACPKCKEKVILNEDGSWLICGSCSVRYPIEEDIPIMLIERAVPIED